MDKKNKTTLIIVADEEHMTYAYHLRDLIVENENNISVVLYTDKEYIKYRLEIDSDIHIVFIGNSRLAKQNQNHISDRFHKFGLHYGWMGKTAVLYVDEMTLPMELWDGLIELKKINDKIMDLPNRTNPFFISYTPVGSLVNVFESFKKDKKEIRKQQYACLITEWYINGFDEFMNSSFS